ncbi:MAG: peptidylprolyl isomerase [Candidatus Omnitrophota bacterium]
MFKKFGAWFSGGRLKKQWRGKYRIIIPVTAGIIILVVIGLILKSTVLSQKTDPVLAVVNGYKIRVSEFKEKTAALPEFFQPYVITNRSQFLQDMVDRELIYQKARLSRYARDPEFKRRMAELKKDILVQEYVHKEILENPNIPEEEMRRYYQNQTGEFVQPASIHLYEILVSERATAENIVRRYKEGEIFEDLARKYSQVPSAPSGGDLGFVREGKIPKQLEEVAFKLFPNQVSSPIQTEAGFYVLKAGQKILSRQLAYKEAVPLIKKMLASKYGEENYKDFLKNLRAKSRVKIMGEAIEKIRF